MLTDEVDLIKARVQRAFLTKNYLKTTWNLFNYRLK